MPDRLVEIKEQHRLSELDKVRPLDEFQIDWLISEVERLTGFCKEWVWDEESFQREPESYQNEHHRLQEENKQLKAENERLHHFVDEVDKLFENVKRERVGKQ